MPKYKVSWAEEQWYEQTVEASDHAEAIEMIFSGDVEWPEPHGWEIQDSVDVEEIYD